MAYKALKSKAYRFFSKGWNPPDTAAKIGSTLRSTQRWYQEFLQENPDFAMVGKMPVAIVPIQEIEKPQILTTEINEVLLKDDWVAWANNLSNTHLKTHGEIREKMARMLNAALDSSEANIRSIHVLSQCLCRHTEAERTSSFLDMLVADRAYRTLEALGYVILDPTEE